MRKPRRRTSASVMVAAARGAPDWAVAIPTGISEATRTNRVKVVIVLYRLLSHSRLSNWICPV